jgi:DNA-binding PucR family transcriptional regulator
VSEPAESVTALPGSLHEAGSARRLAALRLAGLGGISVMSVVTSDEGASHELLLATVPPSVLRSFREFLACSGSWNACAVRMYVHVNTVRYRIKRIEELTGRDLSRLDDQVDFFLALQIR